MWRWLPWMVLLVLSSSAAAQQTPPSAKPDAKAEAPNHKPLRTNPGNPQAPPAPVDLAIFQGYADAPPFEVVPRKDHLTYFPCAQCHQYMPVNPEPRELMSPHPGAISHGKGRIWCLNCHHPDDRDNLQTLRGEKVDFDQAYMVCGQCHANRQQDWYFGGHGKRVANWQGERTLYSCTHCHDPHQPAVKGREPSPMPPIRAGLTPMEGNAHPRERLWERYSEDTKRGSVHE